MIDVTTTAGAGSESPASLPCRLVTPEEVAHYQEYGWALLRQFVQPQALHALLDAARLKMGDDADSNPVYGGGIDYFNAEFGGGMSHPQIRPMIEGIGRSAKLLMVREADVGVRWYQDIFVPKLPSGKKSSHGGNGATSFHQDFISFAVDRSGGMTFWVPMESYGPEAGTMSFVNGSHRLGSLGDYRAYGGRDAFEVYPELRRMEVSEPLTYALGDISVHSHLTVHGAGANMMNRPRWAYLVLAQPADACWTGQPCENFDHSQMEPFQPFDDERFPLIG